MKQYEVNFLSTQANKQYQFECANTIQFVNTGVATVVINQSVNLSTGQTFTIEGNENEICVTSFNVNFIFVEGQENNCLIIVKTYL